MSDRLDDDALEEFVPIEPEDFEDFGACCVCGCDSTFERPVRNIICLDFKHPVPGDGWGCATCNLPPDGAVAVICDRCLEEKNFDYKFIVAGHMKDKSRIPYPEIKEPFFHDEAKHTEQEKEVLGFYSDPEWDYRDLWNQLSRIFRDLSQLQSYIMDRETATVDSDIHIYNGLRETATKLKVMADLLVHPVDETE